VEKEGLILVVATDSLSGEELGYAINGLQEVGAYNVNLIPTITKKNRPGQLMIVDLPVKNENAVGNFLVKEFGILGYHRIKTEHVFEQINFIERKLSVRGPKGWVKNFELQVKVVGDMADPLSMDVENDFLVKLHKELNADKTTSITMTKLRKMVESALQNNEDPLILEI